MKSKEYRYNIFNSIGIFFNTALGVWAGVSRGYYSYQVANTSPSTKKNHLNTGWLINCCYILQLISGLIFANALLKIKSELKARPDLAAKQSTFWIHLSLMLTHVIVTIGCVAMFFGYSDNLLIQSSVRIIISALLTLL